MNILQFIILVLIFNTILIKSGIIEKMISSDDTLNRIKKIDHKVYGEIYIFGGGNDVISAAIGNDQIWESDLCNYMSEYYESGTDMLDIGANLGLNSLQLNNVKKITGTVHLFEPQNDVFTMLKYNTRNLNRKLYNITLGLNSEILSFVQQYDNVGGTSIFKENQKGNVFVSSVALDQIEFKNKISLIKMDVEGGEFNVLVGAKETLKKHKPNLIIEIWEFEYKKVSNLLKSMDYVQIKKLGVHDYLFQPKREY